MKLIRLLFLVVLLAIVNVKAQSPVYLDSTATVDERVRDLLNRMTLDEKIGQMTQADIGALKNWEDILKYHLGSILSGGGSDPQTGNLPVDWANMYDSLQQIALKSRLKIPIIYGIDAVHGHSNVVGAVIFPHNIGMGATGDSLLAFQEGQITALEMAATGIDWTFAPCIAVPRDERWGRTYEGFGETPEKASKFGSAEIMGLQNNSNFNSRRSVVACAKHYLGDGGTTGGVDQGNTELSEAQLRAIHLPGYITAVKNGVRTIMASYSSWNGVKMHSNKYLLTDVLKNELGFKGFVVSDWAAINQLNGDYSAQVQTAINAGIDMVMVPIEYAKFFNTLKSLVQQGKVSELRINDAVSRILKVKFEFGLFEHPFSERSLLPLVGSEEHRKVARRAVRESLVFLKKNDNVLPLPKSNVKILVAGEHANNLGYQCGGWTIEWQGGSGNITKGVTILDGLKKIAPNAEIVYDEKGESSDTTVDYIIAVIGEKPYAEGRGDRQDLTLEREQILMIRRLRKLGKPLITILISGRPMIINPVLHSSDVFVAAWLPGTEGDGIAQVLFGDYIPHGHLPVSWPKNMEQIPINWGDSNYAPLFPYGFGITSFDNSPVGSALQFQSGMVTEDGMHIEINFNKAIKFSNNIKANFEVRVNGQVFKVSDIQISKFSKNTILLKLSHQIEKGDLVKLEYLNGNISAADNGVLEHFGPKEIINYLNYLPPIHKIPGIIQAEDYSDMYGIQTEKTSDVGGGLNVGWIDKGDWLEYDCSLDFNGTFFVNYRIASANKEGNIGLFVDSLFVSEKPIPVTGGWQNWQTVSDIVNLKKGKFKIQLLALEGGFNINWFEFYTISDVASNSQINNGFQLFQNYPNPFVRTQSNSNATAIRYAIPKYKELVGNLAKSKRVRNVLITVYDILGRRIKTLINRQLPPGNYTVEFYPENISSGVYFYSLKSGNIFLTKKMLIIN